MSIETEFYGRSHRSRKVDIRKIDGVKLKESQEIKPKKKNWRDIIFGTLFPGLFVFLVYYHFFIYSSATSEFYSRLLHQCLAGSLG